MVKKILASLFIGGFLTGAVAVVNDEGPLSHIEKMIGVIKGMPDPWTMVIIEDIHENAILRNEDLNQMDPRDRKLIYSITLGGNQMTWGEGFMNNDFISQTVAYSGIQEGTKGETPSAKKASEDTFWNGIYQKELWAYGQKPEKLN